MRGFSLLWFGQFVSLIGSGLTGFALGIWVYQSTGSITLFALIALFTSMPGIIVSPLAGALVDRWDRRLTLVLSDTGAVLGTLAIALLLVTGRLQVWHIYVVMSIGSALSALQWPAQSAAVTLLVPKRQLGRAAGMVEMAHAVAQIASPALAGVLIVAIGIHGVIMVDAATYLVALLTLLVISIPKPPLAPEGLSGKAPLWRDALFGWKYIKARRGLLGLLTLFAATNFSTGLVSVLVTPLILSVASPVALGSVLSFAGIGMLAGSLVMSAWGGPRRRVYGVLGGMLLQGLVLFLAVFRPSVPMIAMAAFCFLFAGPMVNSSSQAIWQSKVAPALQGRVFAVRRMIAWSSLPAAYLLAGPLADRVFEPLMAVGGPLAGSAGRIIGAGPGRGIALLYALLAFAIIGAVLLGYLSPRIRGVEDELPDALPAD